MWWEAEAEYVGFKVEVQYRIDTGAFIGHINDGWRFTNQQMIQEKSSSTIVMLNELHEYTDFAQYFPTQVQEVGLGLG